MTGSIAEFKVVRLVNVEPEDEAVGVLSVRFCELCQNDEVFNFHHLIPRTLHSNKWFKKRFTRDEMRAGIHLCRECHRALHDFIPQLAQFVEWKRRRLKHNGAEHSAAEAPWKQC